ncbi:MAG: hypothetical protein CMF26_03050 [Kiloniella sp.]|nr:hypothetical protein [Kiloniella sp.]RZO29821.1 MAG: hypothetical protein EVA88_03640 [Rhodospirillaceae bacterium]
MPKNFANAYAATAAAAASDHRTHRQLLLRALGVVVVMQMLMLTWLPNAQAQGNSFAVATRYGEILCTSALAEDRKSLEVSCAGRDGAVVSAYRQLSDGTVEVLMEIGKVGEAVTLAIFNSQDKG